MSTATEPEPLDVEAMLAPYMVDEEAPYGTAQRLYAAAGWVPLPLPYRKKSYPPGDFTGEDGRRPTEAERTAWADRPQQNICLRLDGVAGIDVDAYEGKPAVATLADKEAAWGALPPTWTSSSRFADDAVSGIRFYRVPAGTKLIGQLLGIDIIQRHHRYAVVWPSIHDGPEGRVYRWRNPAGELVNEVPKVDELPELPAAWLEGLRKDNKTPTERRTLATGTETSPAVTRVYGDAALRLVKGSRHDAATGGALALARLAERGHPGADDALERLGEDFLRAVHGDRRPGEAEKEWRGIVESARTKVATTPATTPRWGDDLRQKGYGPPRNVDADTGEVTDDAPALNLPESFWASRPHLTHLRDAAHARGRSADAVLGATLARIAALVPPSIQGPAPIDTPCSLNLTVANVGPSGSGKSGAARASAELVPFHDHDDVLAVSLGSGEGIAEAYMGTVDEADENDKKRKVRQQVRRSVLFLLDEGQALSEMGGRKGSTLLPTIRSAWSGDQLGQANASEDRRRHLPAGSYRFALLAGFQTEYATALIDDAAGGTPQRFLFLPAGDPTIPDIAPAHPGPLAWRPPVHQAGPMGLDPGVAASIRSEALAVSRGHLALNPLDSHRNLLRLKLAGLLALLDDRLAITAEDWELAGEVLDASDRVRASIITAARLRARETERVSTAKVVRRTAEVERDAEDRALEAMAKAIARHVQRGACDGGCVRRCVTQATPGKARALVAVDRAIDEAERLGWITREGDLFRPGKARPS